jgi:hypothetical protein
MLNEQTKSRTLLTVRLWLIGSLAANAVLAALIVTMLFSSDAIFLSRGEQLGNHRTVAGATVAFSSALESSASSSDVTDEQRDRLAYLAVAEHVHGPGLPTQAAIYWQPTNAMGVELSKRQLSAAEAVRQALLGKYGSQALRDPLFAKYFFPLGPAFEFLSSEKQIAIERLRVEARLSMANSNSRSLSLEELRASDQHYVDEVRKLLTEHEFFEFQLRESRLARHLRSLDVSWNEEEFRAVYSVRSEATSDGASIVGDIAGLRGNTEATGLYDPRIEAILGGDRYLSYLAAQDPIYRRMQSVAARTGRSTAETKAAYRQYVDASHEVVELRRSGSEPLARQRTQQRDQAFNARWGAGTAGDLRFRVPSELSQQVNGR